MELLVKILVCFLAGAGAGIGTGFAGMSAAAVIGPILMTFLGVPAYQAVGIGLASDVLASATSAWTYKKHKNLDVKNSLPLLIVCALGATSLPQRIAVGFRNVTAGRGRNRNAVTVGRVAYLIVSFAFLVVLLWLCTVSLVGASSAPSIYANF